MNLNRPFAMLFSDPNGVHHAWLTERCADATFAPTRETYAQAREAGAQSVEEVRTFPRRLAESSRAS